VDISPRCELELPSDIEFILGNLCDEATCRIAVLGVHTVMHFAANMGGMGTIHEANDSIIYLENSLMSQHLVSASIDSRVKRFFYASSACVYPNSLQTSDRIDVALKESDIWRDTPPMPQGLYGLEKLVSELLAINSASRPETQLDVRIARFHNVYGPGGAWANGREKAPAALLRKALVAKLLREDGDALPAPLEIWGDGKQRRSFLYIDDAVEAIWRLLNSPYSEPMNIGSPYAVSIRDLAQIAVESVGIEFGDVQLCALNGRPQGVASRNADLTLIQERLGWTPRTSLEDGMNRTGHWISKQMLSELNSMHPTERTARIQSYKSSLLVDLQAEIITFALLLPVTSRRSAKPDDCLHNLVSFAQSLISTTWRDVHQVGGIRFRTRIYLAIDHDDTFLWDDEKALQALKRNGLADVVVLSCNHPPGHVCALWRDCAHRAWKDRCDYYLLAGDDVTFKTGDWMSMAHSEFQRIAKREGVPAGFGCVAFTDVTFPGMPTFPIIHRTHLDIFDGKVVPDVFVNQDGDPFLYQLYRRFGCSTLFPAIISNEVGGEGNARYDKQHTIGWTYETLDEGTTEVERWISSLGPKTPRKLTLDVIIPCYRVQLHLLNVMLNLKASLTCSTMFIVIVDNPTSPHIRDLQEKHGARADVRIRVNCQNMGASASRNRGLSESAAEWVLFLDDDVEPAVDILLEAEKSIRMHRKAAGFVGYTDFPKATTIFTTAVHLAMVTYFWGIARKMEPDDIPWGVTANLIARRYNDGVEFDLRFPKTGGGEDIDYCRKKRQSSLDCGGEGFWAAPRVSATHPWWNGGARSYHRFYMWSKGDGGLISLYPQLSYLDATPNSAELLFASMLITAAGLVSALIGGNSAFFWSGVRFGLSVMMANVVHDLYRHLWREPDRVVGINSSIGRVAWFAAIIESTFIRIWSEVGRLVGMLERGELRLLGRRFDWFAERVGENPRREERSNGKQRLCIVVGIWSIMAALM
jgi:nucleoside-diphosphate-sugar epimerase/glycosyltransferase involved in cell wall biosynthesis